jgi:hypothetical protein
MATTKSKGTVYVSAPPATLNNLAKFNKLQQDILGKLGCRACCSGWDIRYNREKIFIETAKGLQQF